MAAATQPEIADARTRALIERIAAGPLGAKLRSQVARRHGGAGRDELEEAFQEACAIAQRACRGQSEREVYAWLRTTTQRELVRLRQRAARRSRVEIVVDLATADLPAVAATERAPDEQLIDREDQADVERAARAVLERLSEPQRAVAALYGCGHRRAEIAAQLGVSPRSVKRALERILAIGRDELVRLGGRGCDAGGPLVARYAFGLTTNRQARQAQLHLLHCARCGALYQQLDLWRAKVAALAPLLASAANHHGVLDRVVQTAGEQLPDPVGSASHGLSVARRHLSDALVHAREHAATAYSRVADPTPLAGLRPGAIAATVAGCLALGGGATYCINQHIDPLGNLGALAGQKDHHSRPRAKPTSQPQHHPTPRVEVTRVAATAAPPPTPTPTAIATATPTATPSPTKTATVPISTPQTPPPAPQDEFQPTSNTVTAAPTAAPQARTPAPAPAGGATEFGGP